MNEFESGIATQLRHIDEVNFIQRIIKFERTAEVPFKKNKNVKIYGAAEKSHLNSV